MIAQACNLATVASTNWYLERGSTTVLNGAEGSSREEARPFALDRVRAHVRQVSGAELPDDFRLDEALDRLAVETGAVGWLEKTPLHVLSIPEIEHEIPDARFVHFIRDPEAVVLSLVRRARANPTMIGARHQLDQEHDRAIWRTCVCASLAQLGRDNHLLVYSEAFVDNPEGTVRPVAGFLDVAYRSPEDPDRAAAARASTPSHRPWKRDAAGPVRRLQHDDEVALEPLDAQTESLWREAQDALGLLPTEPPSR